MKRLLPALLLVPVLALGYTSPGKPAGFVNDFAGLLKLETVVALNEKLDQFSKETGNEIAVVTVSGLGDETVETYAEKLFQEWGIGKEKEDNGILLLIAPTERVMRIEVGYGLEPVITDIESGRIIREILTPAFQAGNYDEGVIQAIEHLVLLAQGEAVPVTNTPVNWPRWMIYAGFIFIWLASILARSKSWWAGGVVGGVVGVIFFAGIVYILACITAGLLLDFLVSRSYKKSMAKGGVPPWWIGGGGGKGGGFGGFGGGMSGGGGASGRW
ncbi:MAG: TPM domain-containing protein [bacterium]|nr:TPM domain-containing protein [bacterium]